MTRQTGSRIFGRFPCFSSGMTKRVSGRSGTFISVKNQFFCKMENLEDVKFTLQQRISYVKYGLKNISLREVIGCIRNGDMPLYDKKYGSYTLRQAIEYIRSLDEREVDAWKSVLLPAVAYNGTFTYMDKKGIDTYSPVTAMDFDDILATDELIRLRRRLMITPCVVCVFTTPSGHGLKALVLHDNPDYKNHTDLYEQLLDKFNVASKDESCKDLARRNYLSYDPAIWVNPNPVPYHYVPSTRAKAMQPIFTGKKVSDKSIISIMNASWKKNHPEYWTEGNRASSIFKLACQMCKWGVDEGLAEEYFANGWENDTMSRREIESHVAGAYKAEQKNFGTVEFRIY